MIYNIKKEGGIVNWNVLKGILICVITGIALTLVILFSLQPNSESSMKMVIPDKQVQVQVPEAEPPRISEVVYRTPKGTKYHITKDCPSLSRSKTIEETTVEQAELDGLGACSKCAK